MRIFFMHVLHVQHTVSVLTIVSLMDIDENCSHFILLYPEGSIQSDSHCL